MIINGDYGADHSALSKDHFEICAAKGIFVQGLPPSEPILMQLVLQDRSQTAPSTCAAHVKARISTTLEVVTGPLLLRNLEYLVFDEPMREVILARPILQTICFDLDKHLEDVGEQFDESDFSHIGFAPRLSVDPLPPLESAPGQLSRLLSCSLTDGELSHTLPTTNIVSSFTDLDVSTGGHVASEVQPDLDAMITSATDNGFPSHLLQNLRDLLDTYRDIFRTKMGSDPPASVPPMTMQMRRDAKPVRVKVRRYSPPQAVFLRRMVEKLMSFGLVYFNPSSQWALAPLIAPKAGPEQYRFTFDIHLVNTQTEPIKWPMPHLDTVLMQLAGSTCYASSDFCHGY